MLLLKVFLRSLALVSVVLVLATLPGGRDARAQSNELNYLYRITTLRAAPGRLAELIDVLKRREQVGYYLVSGDQPPMLMRHSQGDQWDLFLIYPMESYAAFYSEKRIERRSESAEFAAGFDAAYNPLVAYKADLFAFGPTAEVVRQLYDENAFYHIEMFEALAGQADALLQERIMENDYLIRTGRSPNLIFVGDQGTNVDSFTIGFYQSLQHYAAPSGSSASETDAAAKAAGFPDGNSIGTYLRRFISAHHDTLAVKVP